eukprot:TRINITY_DN20756_c0_g1_i1.p1 TRINITY_DN20756_c0_g1~~TRINITY_DN20756_c0_g1_i1.p1  ORF type:complete len:647 (+),score=101.98 TRINITY_DN20756_c0_g1_i1:112-2052(+)
MAAPPLLSAVPGPLLLQAAVSSPPIVIQAAAPGPQQTSSAPVQLQGLASWHSGGAPPLAGEAPLARGLSPRPLRALAQPAYSLTVRAASPHAARTAAAPLLSAASPRRPVPGGLGNMSFGSVDGVPVSGDVAPAGLDFADAAETSALLAAAPKAASEGATMQHSVSGRPLLSAVPVRKGAGDAAPKVSTWRSGGSAAAAAPPGAKARSSRASGADYAARAKAASSESKPAATTPVKVNGSSEKTAEHKMVTPNGRQPSGGGAADGPSSPGNLLRSGSPGMRSGLMSAERLQLLSAVSSPGSATAPPTVAADVSGVDLAMLRRSLGRSFVASPGMKASTRVITQSGVVSSGSMGLPAASSGRRNTSPPAVAPHRHGASYVSPARAPRWAQVRSPISPRTLQRFDSPPRPRSVTPEPFPAVAQPQQLLPTAPPPPLRAASPLLRTWAWTPSELTAPFPPPPHAALQQDVRVPEAVVAPRPLVHAASLDMHDRRRRSPSPPALLGLPRAGSPGLPRAGSYSAPDRGTAQASQPGFAFGMQRSETMMLPMSSAASAAFPPQPWLPQQPQPPPLFQFHPLPVRESSPGRRQTLSGESIVRTASPGRGSAPGSLHPQSRPPPRESAGLSDTCRRLQEKLGGLNGEVLDIVHL